MSTRTRLAPFKAVSGGDMSGNITSTATLLQSISMVNYSVTWSGTSPVGTLQVQASNDATVDAGGNTSGGTWNPIPLNLNGAYVTSIPISGNTGNGMIDIDGLAAYAIRLVYTSGSGSGTLNALVTGKVA